MAKQSSNVVQDFSAEFLDVLGRIRRLRKMLRTTDSDALIGMRDRLDIIIAERKEEEEAAIQAMNEKRDNILKLKKLMDEMGISDEDMQEGFLVEPKIAKANNKVPKYLYVDNEGTEHRWSGRGRIPKIFRELVETGVDLDKECLASKIEQ